MPTIRPSDLARVEKNTRGAELKLDEAARRVPADKPESPLFAVARNHLAKVLTEDLADLGIRPATALCERLVVGDKFLRAQGDLLIHGARFHASIETGENESSSIRLTPYGHGNKPLAGTLANPTKFQLEWSVVNQRVRHATTNPAGDAENITVITRAPRAEQINSVVRVACLRQLVDAPPAV